MPRKDNLFLPGAAGTLKGLAGEMAAMVRARTATFIAEPADPKTIDAAMRTIALIARAALAVQSLQAAEDKAEQRATDTEARRRAASVHARNPIHHEADETDMNEPDPRLDDPEAMAEVSQEIGRRVDRLAQFLEQKRTARRPYARADAGGPDPLDRAGASGPAPA